MYNFVDPKLLPKVTSDTSALEHYEVANLISPNGLIRARGFIAHQVAKPPVQLTFQLICPVNLHYLVLSTMVGTTKCTAVEISAKSSNSAFEPIAYAKYEASGIIFCNGRRYSQSKLPGNINPDYHLSFFKSKSFRSFSTAEELKVTILRTNNRVPCLGKVEIWGKPSKVCSSTTATTIDRLVNGGTNFKEQEVNEKPIEVIEDTFAIPDDFKDSLTFEIMAIPITLPSGNTIDQSTLEKYVSNEAVYGRPASDPFTSQHFTGVRKPVLNVALKSRIDLFLLENANRKETFQVKRTVGQKIPSYAKLVDSLQVEEPSIKRKSSEDSLEEAIKRAKGNASFVSFTQDVSEVKADKCEVCDTVEYLFVVPCKHFYCRTCLVELCKSLKCSMCDKQFAKKDRGKYAISVGEEATKSEEKTEKSSKKHFVNH